MHKYKYILNLMEFLAHDFGDISFAVLKDIIHF